MSQGDIRYPPIGDYGMIGDLRSAALVSKQGSIDWMCLPRFDSPWIFGRLLDWDKGGYLQLGLPGGALAYRQYRRDSNVIQTVWSNGPARMRVVDWMPIAVTNNRVRPPESLRLIRMMQPVAGTSQWRLTFKPRFDYGREVPSVRPVRPGLLSAASPQGNVFLQIPEDAAIALGDGEAIVTGRVLPGHRAAVLLHYTERGGRPPAPITMDQAHAYLHQTDDYWLGWLRSSSYRGRFDEPLHRSALALKLMQYLPTGAFVAAPTTSLPESLGGSLNWDYRYTWIRDTSDLVNALHQLGFQDEVDAFLRWVRMAHDRHPEHFQIMYTIDGEDRVPEYVLDDLEGYRRSKPVRIGNAAVEQLQLDIYGEFLYSLAGTEHLRSTEGQAAVAHLLDWLVGHWARPDEGIWETRGGRRDFTYSRLMCWVAFEHGLRIAPQHENAGMWAVMAHAIADEIQDRGWDAELGSYVQSYGASALDASLLLMPVVGFAEFAGPFGLEAAARWRSTLAAIEGGLTHKGLCHRYRLSDFSDGLAGEESSFDLCTLLFHMALAGSGDAERAQRMFTEFLGHAGPTGLFAEELAPDGEQLGNFPQAFTHLGVIWTALALDAALDAAGAP